METQTHPMTGESLAVNSTSWTGWVWWCRTGSRNQAPFTQAARPRLGQRTPVLVLTIKIKATPC